MEIRSGEISEIETFDLYHVDNEGDDILVAEVSGEIVGYIQYTGNIIFFIESKMKGVGTALMDALKADEWHLMAENTVESAIGFYEKMGFELTGGTAASGYKMEWYEEE